MATERDTLRHDALVLARSVNELKKQIELNGRQAAAATAEASFSPSMLRDERQVIRQLQRLRDATLAHQLQVGAGGGYLLFVVFAFSFD